MKIINSIYYNQKYIWKKMRHTLKRKNLEYRGPYQLHILQKAMPTPARGYEPVPVFYVETQDKKYSGMLEVTLKEYEKGRVGQGYGSGGVILNSKKDSYYISKYEEAQIAIRKAVNWARIRFLVLAIVALLFVSALFFMTLPLLR